ncbi:MAG: hypothetical protein QHH75_10855 [Bacillota bacterium]|nr:hypothetical protein [Bacillota bacterium]
MADDRRELFWRSVLSRTRNDLVPAAREMSQISEKYQDESRYEFYDKIQTIFSKYPVYKKMLSESLAEEIKPAVTAVVQGKIKVDAPLYSVLGGRAGLGASSGGGRYRKPESLLWPARGMAVLLSDVCEEEDE